MTKFKHIVVLPTADLLNVNAKASDELAAAVAEGNGRAGKFVYTAAEIVALALRAERRLERSGLPQADRVGFEAMFEHEGPSAAAYKYSAAGRSVTLRRGTKGWMLTHIDEITVYPKSAERVTYRATEAQISEMQRRAVADLKQIAA